MSHQAWKERVVDLALGLLPPREAAEVEAHAAGCAGCAAELASLRGTRAALTALEPLPAPERGEAVLLAAAREAVRLGETSPPRRLPRWAWAAAFGAVGATAAVVVSLQLTGTPPPSRFDAGHDALLGRAPAEVATAPQPATAAPAPSAPPPTARQPAVAAEAKEVRPEAQARSADEAEAPPPPRPARAEAKAAKAQASSAAQADAGGPAPGARGEIGIGEAAAPAAALAVADAHAVAMRAAPIPPPQAEDLAADEGMVGGVVGSTPVPSAAAAPARAKRLASAPAAEVARTVATAGAPPARPPASTSAPVEASPADGPGLPGAPRLERSTWPDCTGERSRTLARDAQGSLLWRDRTGLLRGVAYRCRERYDATGRLVGATVRLGEREVTLGAADLAGGRLEPFPGLRLEPQAAAAESAPPACRP